ncbi:MAG: hypothetical protein KKG78_15910 [Alphaproteobacteria bacterium]|nr:hypothetical protein [Alphaproteobacteria bacterium]
MSIDKDLLDRLMEGRSPGNLFGKTGILVYGGDKVGHEAAARGSTAPE